MTYDVAIAGAGPAGSVAASKLAEAGMRTFVIDSKMEVGAPVICADLVNIGFGELQEFMEDPRIRLAKPENIELKAGKASVHMFPSGKEGDAFNTVVERDRLDKELISGAVLAGAKLTIRAELINYFQEGDLVRITYRAAGKAATIRATHAVIATGNPGSVTENSSNTATEFSYQYGRFTSKAAGSIPVIEIGKELSMNYLVPRGHGQFNRLQIKEFTGEKESPGQGIDIGRAFISGSRRAIHSEEPALGSGRILLAGSAAGLYDRFFMTGYREAFISGKIAAQAILGSNGEGGEAVKHYAKAVDENLIPGMDQQLLLRKAMAKSDIRRIEELLSRLSEYEFNEVSVRELLGKSGMSIKDIEEILGTGS